jgi:hypothetical protein
MSEEKEKIRLTVLARKTDIHWQNILDDSIRFQKAVFVRLKGQGTLTILDEVDSETKQATFMNLDMKNRLWELPYSELEKLMIDMPPWHITSVVPPDIVQEDPKHFQFQFRGESINENNLFLVKKENKTHESETDESKLEVKQFPQENLQKRKAKPVKKEHTLLFLRALIDCDKKQKKESTADQIWKHLKENLRRKYDAEEAIISTMTNFEMMIIKSSGNDECIDSESFARAIRRLREEFVN